jgi:hypothetical protein
MCNIHIWKEKNLFLLHLREYQLKNGHYIPQEKGIALTYEVWKAFLANLENIKDDVEEYYNFWKHGKNGFKTKMHDDLYNQNDGHSYGNKSNRASDNLSSIFD